MTAVGLRSAEDAIKAALGYIISNQSEDGSWVDWQLPTGESDAWTTAYVGWKLSELPDRLRGFANSSILKAAHWLIDHAYSDGGWGYNSIVGSDADSTAFSILLLVAAGESVSQLTRDLLLRPQRMDGGFATYLVSDANDSWGVSHPDVTPIALRALISLEGEKRATIDAGVECVLRTRTKEGGWNSFWWDTPLYGTEASISFLKAANVEWDALNDANHLLATNVSNAFERSLLASSLIHLSREETDSRASNVLADLVTEQLADGSWMCPPMLRVTRRDRFEPWRDADAGLLFSDPKRLFTSATVLGALSEANGFLL